MEGGLLSGYVGLSYLRYLPEWATPSSSVTQNYGVSEQTFVIELLSCLHVEGLRKKKAVPVTRVAGP
jgi:hypothetical protein